MADNDANWRHTPIYDQTVTDLGDPTGEVTT